MRVNGEVRMKLTITLAHDGIIRADYLMFLIQEKYGNYHSKHKA